ncbi:cytochrome c family protein [Burkholderia thailandensis Phuket 4W-1]|nr:cytochrome c family protein [Burkholderia thailandensis Phuket 4W-1]
MKSWGNTLARCAIAGLFAAAAFAQIPPARPASVSSTHADAPRIIDDLPARYSADLDAATRAQVERGRYIARLGDCVACHTGDKSKPLAGGLALQTPFGELHSTNITPEPQTGIGRYTFEQFDRAMRSGVAADGHHLYPAMPYPSYAKVSPEDMRALYAYLMKGVAPVRQANRALALRFPFNQRWGLALWNWAFLDDTPFQPDATRSAEWNRGAYIVQGLGHCGACHTPRGFGFQEKAMSGAGSAGPYFLAGETVEGWRALSLRALWTPQDTAEMLKTGRNRYGTVSGNMVDVVQHSTQYMSDGDLLAVGAYLESLPAAGHDKPMLVPQGPARAIAPAGSPAAGSAARVPADLYTSRGGLGYLQFCNDCHRSDGAGVRDVFPPLAGNAALLSKDPSTLVHIMLTGWRSAQTARHARALTMPAFAQLSDQEIAEILNFARKSWGRADARAISAGTVGRMRKQLRAGTGNDTRFQTPRLADMLAESNAGQLTLGARLNIDTRRMLLKHVGND